MIAMPLGLNPTGLQSMCVTLSDLCGWEEGRGQDKLWYASEIPVQSRKEPFTAMYWFL